MNVQKQLELLKLKLSNITYDTLMKNFIKIENNKIYFYKNGLPNYLIYILNFVFEENLVLEEKKNDTNRNVY